MRLKKIIVIFVILLTLSINKIAFADDNLEEIELEDTQSILLESTVDVQKEPSINSRHAIVYDRKSGVILYGKKENEKCKMASTTKIMTAIVVLENEENLDKKVKISAKSAGTGGSRLGLKKDDEISVRDLLYGLLLCSRKRCSSSTCRSNWSEVSKNLQI